MIVKLTKKRPLVWYLERQESPYSVTFDINIDGEHYALTRKRRKNDDIKNNILLGLLGD